MRALEAVRREEKVEYSLEVNSIVAVDCAAVLTGQRITLVGSRMRANLGSRWKRENGRVLAA
jgi:hypothetical protein